MILQFKAEYPRLEMFRKFCIHMMHESWNRDPSRTDFRISPLELDPFFLELIKQHKLGTKITAIWVHWMLPKVDRALGHNHPYATAVYYIQTPEGSGHLVLPELKEDIKPEEDLFVVIPPKAIHQMLENTGNGIRLAMAFNFE